MYDSFAVLDDNTGLATTDFRRNTGFFRKCLESRISFKREITYAELTLNSTAVARAAVKNFFNNFDWNVSEDVIKFFQNEFLEMRVGGDR